jgi:hypothetical protein
MSSTDRYPSAWRVLVRFLSGTAILPKKDVRITSIVSKLESATGGKTSSGWRWKFPKFIGETKRFCRPTLLAKILSPARKSEFSNYPQGRMQNLTPRISHSGYIFPPCRSDNPQGSNLFAGSAMGSLLRRGLTRIPGYLKNLRDSHWASARACFVRSIPCWRLPCCRWRSCLRPSPRAPSERRRKCSMKRSICS